MNKKSIKNLKPMLFVVTPNNGWSNVVRDCFDNPNVLDRDDIFNDSFIDFALSGKVTSTKWTEVPTRYYGSQLDRQNFRFHVKWA